MPSGSVSKRRIPSRLCQSSMRSRPVCGSSTSIGSVGPTGVSACVKPSRSLGLRISRHGASIAVSSSRGARAGTGRRGGRGKGLTTASPPAPNSESARTAAGRMSIAASVARRTRSVRSADESRRRSSTPPRVAGAGASRVALLSTSPAALCARTRSPGRWRWPKRSPRFGLSAGLGVATGTTTSCRRRMAASTPSLLNAISSPAGTAKTSRLKRAKRAAARTSCGTVSIGGSGGGCVGSGFGSTHACSPMCCGGKPTTRRALSPWPSATTSRGPASPPVSRRMPRAWTSSTSRSRARWTAKLTIGCSACPRRGCGLMLSGRR